MKIENLNLSSLKYFFDAVEAQSLTKAAETNFVTRPAISQAILRLEEWAGKPLTTHRKKSFELTPAGEEFYRHMKVSFLDFKKTIESPVASHTLKMGCSASLAEFFLLPYLKKMDLPESFHFVTGTSKQLASLLEEEKIHLSLSVKESGGLVVEDRQLLHKGHFVLASRDGKMKSQIFVTELRPEVTALKRHFLKSKNKEISFLTVESWSLSARFAKELGCACLVPDFLLGNDLKKIPLRGFQSTYEIVLESLPPERLSKAELQLLKLIQR
ncbi:LysR family transcriptional regulator [Bdellovibrio bacteriovorus]|uniref:LysR family transcriptional regulator n=1 Tax=Bdellovibrio bacteriovorus TaxID=959 RepID=UPI0035A993DB